MTDPNRTANRSKPRPCASRLGYEFDPTPKCARELREQGKISSTDYLVLVELLKYQRGFRGSCWTTKARIAQALDVSTKTVQRSYRHLAEAGLISLREVSPPGHPDPDEPANRTGYRIRFLFVDAAQMHAPKPGGGDTDVPPPRDTDVPQFRKPYGLSLDGTDLDDDDKTGEAPSSSSFAPLHQDPERPHGAEACGPPPAPKIPSADACTHSTAEDPPAVPELPPELVEKAAEAVPGATQAWMADLLRDCGEYGLQLALLVLAWVLKQGPRVKVPTRYARTALDRWLTQLRAGTIDMAGVRVEVFGRSAPRASPAAFDPAAWLARVQALGWALQPDGKGGVVKREGPGAPEWSKSGLGSELWGQSEAHKDEIKAHILARAKGVCDD